MTAGGIVGVLGLLGLAALIALRPALVIRAVIAPLCPGVLFRGSSGERQLALTIDDGPSGPGSDALLDLLRELQVPATFFLIGSHLGRHPRFPRREFLRQVDATAHRIRRGAAPRIPHLAWLRPGRGLFHPPLLRWAASRRLRLVLGSIFPWDTLRPPLGFQRRFILANAHPGGILVLHDTPELSGATLATLRAVLPELKRQGYRFVDLESLSAPAPPGSSC